MRTTVSVDDEVLKRARAQARRSGVTLSALVEQALKAELDRVESSAKPGAKSKPFRLITFGGGGLNPGFTWENLEQQAW